MRIDLHTHSTVSDGTDTPTELVGGGPRRAGRGGADRPRHLRRSRRGGGGRAERRGAALPRAWSCRARATARACTCWLRGRPAAPGLPAEMERVRGGRTGRLLPVLAKLAELGVPVQRGGGAGPGRRQPVGRPPAHRRRAGSGRSCPGPYGGLRSVPGRRRSGARAALRHRDRARHRSGARRRRGGGDRTPVGPRPRGAAPAAGAATGWSPSTGWTASRSTTKITTRTPGRAAGAWPRSSAC